MARPATHLRLEGWPATAAIGCACGALALLGFFVTLNSAIVDQPVLYATMRGIGCFGLVAVGLYASSSQPAGRYPTLVLALSAAYSLGALTAVDDPWLFALGRIELALTVVLSAYVFLSYPRGTVGTGAPARLIAGAAAGMAVLVTANLLLSDAPPVAGPFVRCGSDCPENPLAIVDTSAQFGRVLSGALGIWTVLTLGGTAILLARRMRTATALERRSLGPVLAWTALASAGYATYVLVRVWNGGTELLGAMGTVVAIIITLIPGALTAGLVRGRVVAANALRRMVVGLGERPSPAGLRDVLARAFRDPSLQLVFWLPSAGRYVDELGRPVELPSEGEELAVTRFDRDDEPVAAAIHDRALAEDAPTLAAAGGAVLLALQTAHLEADLRSSVNELRVSRARLVSVADEERRRIERDLHDGAQQELIALRIKLALLEELEDERSIANGLAEAGARVDDALEHIRDLAHGIYPSTLRDGGLEMALASVARESPLTLKLDAAGIGRFAPEIETAVYFCCMEALQNVAKHAGEHTAVDVRVRRDDGVLWWRVVDEGPGFDPARTNGSHGITGMRDRMGAVGGELEIVSSPGHGTTVAGRVKVPAR